MPRPPIVPAPSSNTDAATKAYVDSTANASSNFYPFSESSTKPTETVITSFQSGHGFTLTSGGGSISDDTNVYCRGSQSLKCTTAGTGTQLRVTKTSINPTINIEGKMVRILLRTDDPTDVLNNSGQVFVGFSSDNFASHYFYYSLTYSVAHEYGGQNWFEIGCSPSNMNTTGTPDLTAINAIRLYVKDNPVGVFNIWFQSISIVSPPAQGIVSLTFDDGHTSIFTQGVKKMSEYAMPGTLYMETDQVGGTNYVNLQQLKSMQNDNGWDIAAHHQDDYFTTLDANTLEESIRSTKSYLLANGFQKGADHLAYPHGNYNQTVLPVVAKYFKTGRQSSSQAHDTLPSANPLRIKAFHVDYTNAGSIAAEITKAVNNKDWLILVFHKILASPVDTTDISITDFESIIDSIASSDARVMTVSEVYNSVHDAFSESNLSLSDTTTGNLSTSAHGFAPKAPNSTTQFLRGDATWDVPDMSPATPSDHGLLAWTYDPICATNTYLLPTAGLAQVVRVYIRKATTISNIWCYIAGSGGVGLSNSYVALYQNGTRLTQSTDQSTAWQSSGTKTIAITPQTVTAGNVEVVFWVGAWGTAPTFGRAAGISSISAGLSAANSRFATADSGLTTTAPASLGTKSALSVSFWFALS